jgi:tetratricopeptide (TPR) repeat protein
VQIKKEKSFEKMDAGKLKPVHVQEQFLSVLEKGAHRFKVFFLKLHNQIESWLGSIKKSKKNIAEKKEISFSRREMIVPQKGKKVSKKFSGSVVKQSRNDRGEKQAEDDEPESTKQRFKRKSGGIMRRSWRQTVDFSKKSRKMDEVTSLENKKKEAKEAVKDVSEKKEAPMVSKEVVYPEAKIKKEKDEKIEKVLVERIASDPRDIEAYEKLGNYYEEKKSYDDAMSCFKYVLKLNPRNNRAQKKVEKMQDLLDK